jgi:hypothetical protein
MSKSITISDRDKEIQTKIKKHLYFVAKTLEEDYGVVINNIGVEFKTPEENKDYDVLAYISHKE